MCKPRFYGATGVGPGFSMRRRVAGKGPAQCIQHLSLATNKDELLWPSFLLGKRRSHLFELPEARIRSPLWRVGGSS